MSSEHINNIIMTVVPYKSMRYPSWGDYFQAFEGWTEFKIAQLKSVDAEFLVLVHEIIEQYLTQKRGIKEEDITAFDMAHPELDDPGNCPKAPYWAEHVFAMRVEKMICKELGIRWKDYQKTEVIV